MRLYPDAAFKYLEDPAGGVSTPQSKNSYRQTLRKLQLDFPEHHLEDYTEGDLAAFCGRPELAPATRANYRTRLTGFFSWAAWKGLIEQDPSANLRRVVSGSYTQAVWTHHWLTGDEVARVFDSIDTSTPKGRRNMIIARLGFTAGLRRAEIAGLRWRDVDLIRQQITIQGKGGKLASMFITDSTLPWLRKWHDEAAEGLGRAPRNEPVIPSTHNYSDFKTGWYSQVDWDKPCQPGTIAKLVQEISRESGIEFKPHDMRRSFANMLEQRDASIEQISAALRHADVGVTQRYLEKRQDASYQSVKRIGLDV